MDERAKLAADLQEQINQLTNTENEEKNLNKRQKAEIDRLNSSLQDEKNRSAKLEKQLQEMRMRQLLNEELIKAEGQIDLIKDLLLREPCLWEHPRN